MSKNNKTTKNDNPVEFFLDSIEDESQRNDCYKIIELMKNITNQEPKMWGDSIIGFGEYHYKYDSGREGDFFKVGFSPRKGKISIYLNVNNFENEIFQKLGKYKTGKSCLYISKLKDIDINILKEIISDSYLKFKS
jgi:hypothetical protein